MAIHESLEAGQPLVIAGITFAEEPGLRELDWSFTSLLLVAIAALGLAVLASVVAIMRGRVRLSLAMLALGTTSAVALILPRIDALVPNRDTTNLANEILTRSHGDPAAEDVILLHHSTVHNYETLLALRRPLGVWGNTRETGLGFFVQATRTDTAIPEDGMPIDHPYAINGNNTDHPRLWSDERLIAAWNGPGRVWLIAATSATKNLEKLGLTPHVISEARRKALISNRP
jgi:hypothetical protein